MRRARPARGFTLMEVMVAVAITGMMGAMVAVAFTTGFKAREVVERDGERYRQLRVAMARMEREIGAAFVSDRFDAKKYRDQNDRPTNFIGQRDKLLFTTLSHQRLYADAKESDQAVVEYAVESSQEREAHGRQDLMRRENPVLGEHMDRGGAKDALYEDIKRLEFSYWDSDRKEWVDEWDTRRLEKKSILPTRVKIVITALDENGKETRYTTQTRIMLNTELPRFQ
ncbi:MAG TPA: type II secretion system protein GspJ [Myxococcales bacterium]|jgi:general secretion pathway protein J|nr:type II secretion system protein GspJ [Myxococcales bacterium]